MTPDTSSAPTIMDRLKESVEAVRTRSGLRPRVAMILGTGLGVLGDAIEVEASIPYGEIPHVARAEGSHGGRLILGRLDGVPVVALDGRVHPYEGRGLDAVVHPVRLMGLLAAPESRPVLVVSGSVGGMHPLWPPGELVLLDDHINLLGENPLTGPNPDELGPRFPDMSEPYDRELQGRALRVALDLEIPLHRGVYVAVPGPNLETRAEYRMLRRMGADVVGRSTVPEVIAARHMGVRVMGLCVVTHRCLPDALEPADMDTIVRTAHEAGPRLTRLVRGVVAGL